MCLVEFSEPVYQLFKQSKIVISKHWQDIHQRHFFYTRLNRDDWYDTNMKGLADHFKVKVLATWKNYAKNAFRIKVKSRLRVTEGAFGVFAYIICGKCAKGFLSRTQDTGLPRHFNNVTREIHLKRWKPLKNANQSVFKRDPLSCAWDGQGTRRSVSTAGSQIHQECVPFVTKSEPRQGGVARFFGCPVRRFEIASQRCTAKPVANHIWAPAYSCMMHRDETLS